jgi:P4 family phage/plasmid primase-like protien
MESGLAVKPARLRVRSNSKTDDKEKEKKKTIKYKDFNDFIAKHRLKKDDPETVDLVRTHTRIGGEEGSGIYSGSYHISDEEYLTFMKLYYRDIVAKGGVEYLTEKQLTGDKIGPIAIDIDLHFALDIKSRLYSKDHIEDLALGYLDELKKMFQFDESTHFQIYAFEKSDVNPVPSKGITKDGIHMIIGIQCDHNAQMYLRSKMIPKTKEMWGQDLPIVNTNGWEDVFDSGISKGGTNWQLYGSRKPNHEAYLLTRIFDITFDPTDEEWSVGNIPVLGFLNEETFPKLSVRNTGNPQFFYKTEFVRQLEMFGDGGKKKPNSTTSGNKMIGGGESTMTQEGLIGFQELRNIRNADDMQYMIERFLDSIAPSQYVLRETHEFTMSLPETFYGNGSYAKWIRTGWALRNTSERLLITWLAFSAKSATFSYSSIPDLCDQWFKFEKKTRDGLTERSILYWAMQEAPQEFARISKSTVGFYLDQTLNSVTLDTVANEGNKKAKGCGDYDIAMVLFQYAKGLFKCVSPTNNIWYLFKNNRWVKNEGGTTLRRMISDELRDLYMERAAQMLQQASHLDPEDGKTKLIRCKVGMITNICTRLASTNDKRNIMTEAKELFWDPEFFAKMDNNPYLLCFNNGIIDFKEKIFRKGLPEDYVTKSTNIDYVPLNPATMMQIMNEINDFMTKLFPRPNLRKYMWSHLASTLIGTASVNQTFNMYIGAGENGKSVLTDLMSNVLGEYKVVAPPALITQQRGKIGGVSPEIVALKGTRYAVMSELSKGDKMNEGVMKELVSGMEPIKARGLYMIDPLEFIPQFKLIMCSNEFPEIKTQDHGTWRRIRVVNFESRFTDTPVSDDPDKPYQYLIDRNLKEKFPAWSPVFAAMLVQEAFKTDGVVKDCPEVLSASNDYRERQDYLAQFCKDKIAKEPGQQIRKGQLTEEFKVWYSTNFGTRNPSPKDLHEYMDKVYGKQRSGVWYGIRLKMREDEDDIGLADTGCDEDDFGDDVQFNEL